MYIYIHVHVRIMYTAGSTFLTRVCAYSRTVRGPLTSATMYSTVYEMTSVHMRVCVCVCVCALQAVPDSDTSAAPLDRADVLLGGYVAAGHAPQTLPRGPLPQHHRVHGESVIECTVSPLVVGGASSIIECTVSPLVVGGASSDESGHD